MRKLLKPFILLVCVVLILVSQAFTMEEKKPEERAQNLKVLPKKISEEELHTLMRNYSKALGVRCGYCHVKVEGEKPKLDFASDLNPKKDLARKMIKMQNKINKKFLDKIGHHQFEQITCVTCHMGRIKPIITADSLAKK